MCSYRKILSLVVVLCMILLCSGCGNDADAGKYNIEESLVGDVDIAQLSSNRFTQLDSSTQKPLPSYGLDGYKLVCENENLALYIDEEIASIRVADKKSGYVWGALTEKDPENLNKTWTSFAQSVVSISYMDKTGSTKQIGAGHSSAKCKYKYTDNGFICKVDFGRKVDILKDFPNVCIELDGAEIDLITDGNSVVSELLISNSDLKNSLFLSTNRVALFSLSEKTGPVASQ